MLNCNKDVVNDSLHNFAVSFEDDARVDEFLQIRVHKFKHEIDALVFL